MSRCAPAITTALLVFQNLAAPIGGRLVNSGLVPHAHVYRKYELNSELRQESARECGTVTAILGLKLHVN